MGGAFKVCICFVFFFSYFKRVDNTHKNRTISFEMKRIADSWVTEINYVPDCMVELWEGPQLLLAKVTGADGQDWYI